MDYNKGRFVPTINPLSIFSEKYARTPFEGELCVDDETNDIGFWKKNSVSNMWENISRTKDIQNYLDNYEDNTTFPAARAFIADGVIHRFYYNKLELSCWLDESVTNDTYKYYAIKSIKNVNGVQRYITGNTPHDGLNYLNALTSISEKATLVFEVLPNDWYTVEFYGETKNYKASINFMSYPSKTMPIERDLKETGAKIIESKLIRNIDTRLIDVAVRFNQSDGLNKGYLYLNQSIDDLKATIVKNMSDGHKCFASKDVSKLGYIIINDTDSDKTLKEMLSSITPTAESSKFKYWSLNGTTEVTEEILTSTVVSANGTKHYDVYAIMESVNGIEDRITYKDFDKIDTSIEGSYDCSVLFNYIKTNSASKKYKVDAIVETVINNDDVVVELSDASDSRNYVSVLVEQIGENEYINIEDYSILNSDGVDKITIPRKYFGFGRNVIKIVYTESINNPLVDISDFVIPIPVTISVRKDSYFDIDKFIPTGYVSKIGAGLYMMNLKYFAHFTNGRIEDVTDRVKTLQSINATLFGVTQTASVRIYVDHINKIYHDYTFTVFCEDPSISGNNSRIIINNNSTPRILFYDGKSFSLGVYNTSGIQTSVPLSSVLNSSVMSFNGYKATHIRIREIEDSTKLYTDIVDSVDKLVYMNNLAVPIYYSPNEECTLGDIISSLKQDNFDNYQFQYYSINGGKSTITDDDKTIVCRKNKLVKFDVDGTETFLMEVYTKNATIFSVSKDKPFLVEGYYKDETTGKYVCTGAIIHYALQS